MSSSVPSRRLVLSSCLLAVLLASPQALFAATKTWTGTASGNWSVGANWGGTAPSAGDDLVFPAIALNKAMVNDIAANTSFNSLTFTGTDYSVTGNKISLAGNITMNNSALGNNSVSIDIDLPGNRDINLSGTGGGQLGFSNVFTGSGQLNIAGISPPTYEVSFGGPNTFSGGVIAQYVSLSASSDQAFGTGTVTLLDPTTVVVSGVRTFANNFIINGCGVGTNSAINGGFTSVFNGTITVASDSCIGGTNSTNLTFNGAFSGSGNLKAPINAVDWTVTLNANSPSYTGSLAAQFGHLVINGNFGNANVNMNFGVGGTVGGTGTVGNGNFNSPATLAPGQSPGIFNTGNLAINSGATYAVELNGDTVGSGYDQTNVTGTVTLGGTLNATLGYTPVVGKQFIIINNDSNDAVSGTFNGLAQGAQFSIGDVQMAISYTGGDGNDVVLTVITAPVSVPTMPRTTFFALAAGVLALAAFSLSRTARA